MDNQSDQRLIAIQANWNLMDLTQHEAAKQFRISQPCFNQYLKGTIPLNTDIVIKFATLFNIPPSAIDPNIY